MLGQREAQVSKRNVVPTENMFWSLFTEYFTQLLGNSGLWDEMQSEVLQVEGIIEQCCIVWIYEL